MGHEKSLIGLVRGFGLTQMEAEVYCYLLQNPPSTGYRIAKAIGRPFNSTYKVLEELRSKGAILVDGGGTKVARAVPIEDVLDQLEARFHENRRRVVEAVRNLPALPSDDRIYHLGSVDQVYECCRKMLSAAQGRVLLELFPEPCRLLRGDVESCARRGVKVAARVYGRETIEGVRVIHSPFGEEDLARWRAQWCAVFVDGRQILVANLMLDGDGVYEAIWSANLILARSCFSYVNSDFHHYALAEELRTVESLGDLRTAYDSLSQEFPPGGDLGFLDLVERFGTEGE